MALNSGFGEFSIFYKLLNPTNSPYFEAIVHRVQAMLGALGVLTPILTMNKTFKIKFKI